MDKDKVLDEIFKDDPDGLLDVKIKGSNILTEDDRLLASFQEINDYLAENNKEPAANISDMSEYKLYATLKGIRENQEKIESLLPYDTHNLLDHD